MSAINIGGALVVSRRRPVLSVHKVFAGVAELLAQLVHHLLEDDRVHVLAQHVEEEPVAHLGLADDRVDDLAVDEPEPDVEQVGPHPRAEDDDEPVEEDQGRQEAQDEEPEPEEDVDLFVDDVERKDAQGVVLLHLARRAELVESALGHPREDVDHRVDALLLVPLGERDHVETERQEGPVKERVHQEHLTCRNSTTQFNFISQPRSSFLSFR